MNRSAVGPQSLRSMPIGFQSQPQISQNRNVSSRIPPGSKMSKVGSFIPQNFAKSGHQFTAANGATWAFGGGMPMGNAGIGGPRPGPMTSFAQTIGGSSQPSTPLDPSEFPSLSDNQLQPSQSTWATSGAHNVVNSSNIRMTQQQALSGHQQEDIFSTSLEPSSNQGVFRFNNQNTIGQASQSNSTEEFPPLGRSTIGEIGQDRSSNLMLNSGFSAQPNGLGFGSSTAAPSIRGSGLLNALSYNSQANSLNVSSSCEASPANLSGVPNSISLNEKIQNDAPEHETSLFSSAKRASQEIDMNSLMSRQDVTQDSGILNKRGQNPNSIPQNNLEKPEAPEVHDILSGMTEIDRWGLKGFSMMMNNSPAYAAFVTGSDLTSFGFELNSSDLFSSQIFSLWDNEPPGPVMPLYKLPDCYTVSNVAQLETKMANLNDEALIFMFYSSPGDLQQVMAAQELHNRNWRYHKKLQLWLTKDEMMVPRTVGNGTERGYYIFFDVKNWQRERRELTLVYDDLESLPNANPRLG
ncbi:putative not2 family protein [Golovinomyces cichoracearum]|uniref:Putative not2 family protein n=1 Tax=Golovinomyces cichoracearum TaxID=62708 RepID=A0A420HI17_9PEZI|nr:putative not2 family protein [Golovinomyces cichoracearum]